MSTLRKDKRTGVWFLDLRKHGKRHRISLATRDKGIARMKAKLKEREVAGSLQPAKRVSLIDFTEEFLLWAAQRKARETVTNHTSLLRRLKGFLGNPKIETITARHADLFIAEISKELSPHTVDSYLRQLRAMFNIAVKWQYATENPFKSVRFFHASLPEARVLSTQEVSLILSATDPRFRDVFEFMLNSGLRRVETTTLAWDNIRFEKRVMVIRGKGKKVRFVPLLRKAESILNERRHLEQPFAFTRDALTKNYMRAARKAGVNSSLHDLRRTFASHLLNNGFPRETVMKILGHESFKTTDDFYFSLSPEIFNKLSSISVN